MTRTEWRPGAHLVVGVDGTVLGAGRKRLLARLAPAGVILFGRNVGTPEETHALCRAIAAASSPPPFLCVDAEGGTLDRFREWTGGMPSAMALAATGDPRMARLAGGWTARLLSAVGIGLNLAPVVDLALSWARNGIGTRSFGSDPEQAARYAGAFLQGMAGRGVAGVLKHFPGLGASIADPHATLPVIDKKRGDLETDLAPFRTLAGDAPAVLVGHGYYPEVTTDGIFPACLSSEITHYLLREAVGFRGAALSDDLEMEAVDQNSIGEAARTALSAGCDAVLVCHDPDKMEAVCEAISSLRASTTHAAHLAESERRMDILRSGLGAPPDAFDPKAFGEIRAGIDAFLRKAARASITSEFRGRAPRLSSDKPLWVLFPDVPLLAPRLRAPDAADHLREALRWSGRVGVSLFPVGLTDPERESALRGITPASTVIMATHEAHRRPGQVELVLKLLEQGFPVRHLALSTPFDTHGLGLAASACCFGAAYEPVMAGIRFVLGKFRASGEMPAKAPGLPVEETE